VRLGTHRSAVTSQLGEAREFVKVQGFPPTLEYPDLGIQIHTTHDGTVSEVEVARPAQAMVAGRDLLGLPMPEAIAHLERHIGLTEMDSDGAEWSTGLRIWAPLGEVASVVVFDPDATTIFPSPDDVLASMGLAPLERPESNEPKANDASDVQSSLGRHDRFAFH
jgi:hypothetical protein